MKEDNKIGSFYSIEKIVEARCNETTYFTSSSRGPEVPWLCKPGEEGIGTRSGLAKNHGWK
jgi:hypothetical protein